jgi:hypothetical protein
MKRQDFLKVFLGALGAKKIIWSNLDEKSISGKVLYELADPDEQQNFIWQMAENDVPNILVKDLIVFLVANKLIQGDRLRVKSKDLVLPFCDNNTKEKLFQTLYNVRVSMIDNGIEGDYFLLHE